MNALRSSAGVMASACNEGRQTQQGKSRRWRVRLQLGSCEGQARPVEMAERLVVVLKPGNSGGAKGPQFRDNAGSSKGPGHWRKPNNPIRSGAVGGVARDREESLGHERLVCLSVLPCPRAGCGKSARPVR